MKNKIIILMILVVPIAVFALLQYATKDYAANAGSIQEENLNKGKFIKFSSPMCSECKKVTTAVKNVMPEYRDVILYEEINVSDKTSKSEDMIEAYKISVVPTVIFIDKSGKIVNKAEGLVDESFIKENLDKIK